MQIKEVTVHRAVKINIKNYENVDFAVTLTATIDKDEDATAIYSILLQNVRDLIRAEIDVIEQGRRTATSTASRFGV